MDPRANARANPTSTNRTPSTTTVTPTIADAGPSTDGQFAEWTILTATAGSWNVATPGNGEVWFTEVYGSGNRIGGLS